MNKNFYSIIERVLPVVAGTLVILEILLMNQSAGAGKEVRSVDVAIDTYHAENEVLAQEVASASSLMTVAARATELGLVEPTKSQFLTITFDQPPVALNNPQ